MPLSRSLFTHARERPDALAVSLSGGRFSYGELARDVLRLNHALGAIPVRRNATVSLPKGGRLVGVCLGNHACAAPLLCLGLATNHGVAVMDPTWPVAQLAEVLSRLPIDVLFVQSGQSALIKTAAALGIRVVCVDQEWNAFLGDTTSPVPAEPQGGATFLVGFTSGTTSTPKGFARSRQSWRISLEASQEAFALGDASHTLAPGPLSHGLTLYAFAETLHVGAAFYGVERYSAETIRNMLEHNNISRLVVVPTMLETLTNTGCFKGVTNVTTAGAKLSPALLHRSKDAFPNAVIFEYYGASELGFVSVSRHHSDTSSAAPYTVGHPFSHVDFRLMDQGKDVTQGQTGTIHVRADLAINGYLWGDGEAGFRRENGWATVGDMGRIEPDGSLVLLGREGGMIVTAGYNVYPQEVQDALSMVAGIEAAFVTAVADEYLGQRLVAVIETMVGFSAQHLGSCLSRDLPRYKIPRAFYTVEAWPLTTSGKVAKKDVECWISEGNQNLVPITVPI